jgi:hypothetical protein
VKFVCTSKLPAVTSTSRVETRKKRASASATDSYVAGENKNFI